MSTEMAPAQNEWVKPKKKFVTIGYNLISLICGIRKAAYFFLRRIPGAPHYINIQENKGF